MEKYFSVLSGKSQKKLKNRTVYTTLYMNTKNKKTQLQEICKEYYDHKSNRNYQAEPIQDSFFTKVITKIQIIVF